MPVAGYHRPPMSWFPILLVAHITLAVALLLPSVIVPFALRRTARQPGLIIRFLMWLQASGTLVISLGLAATGGAMLWILGPSLVTEPWLLVALGIYAANLLIAAFISRPNLRRLLGLSDGGDPSEWRRRARQQRWIAYGMAGAIGVIGLLMSTKPQLW
jgi:hypothetical protein